MLEEQSSEAAHAAVIERHGSIADVRGELWVYSDTGLQRFHNALMG